jgi:rhodanese-related sulfurtransferase
MSDVSRSLAEESVNKVVSAHPAEIIRKEIQRRLRDPSFCLVNVLPFASFAAGHIPGSVNLPVDKIEQTARQVFPQLSQELVIYCNGPT